MIAPNEQSPSESAPVASPCYLASALTHDFCPWANGYVYWLKHPLVVLALAALVSLAIGWSVAHQGYVAFGGIVAVMLLGVIWPWVGMVGLRASLRFERRRAREGERAAAVLTVANRMPWPAWGLVLERGFVLMDEESGQGAAASDAASVALALARVPGFSECDFRFDFEPTCRGDYPLAVPLLTTAFPFGLWKRQQQVAVESRLLVWPRIVPLAPLPLDQGRSWTLGALSDRRCGYEGDVIGARAFRPGDLLRHVHWAQSARQGQMIVRERQASLTSSVRVVIDGNAAAHSGSGPSSSLEWTLRIAASACQSLLDHDTQLRVDLSGTLLVIEPGKKGEERLNDALARFQPSNQELDLVRPRHDAIRQPRGNRSHQRRGELEIVVTTDRAASRWRSDGSSNRQLIILATRCDEVATIADCFSSSPGAWIVLDGDGDVGAQLKIHWERACHHAWCAAQ